MTSPALRREIDRLYPERVAAGLATACTTGAIDDGLADHEDEFVPMPRLTWWASHGIAWFIGAMCGIAATAFAVGTELL